MSVSEWADKYRYLPSKTSVDAGRWQNSRTPYLVEIMDCLSEGSPYREICFMKGTQIGGTSAGENFMGYTMHLVPASMLWIVPTSQLARLYSVTKLQPMIEYCQPLSERIKPTTERTAYNTLLNKNYEGGSLVIFGANNPANLRSFSVKNILMDEIDEFPKDIGGQGSPLDLAKTRTQNYAESKKIYYLSTPTIDGASVISELFERSDKRFYNVPCPFCGEYQTLEFESLKWDTEKTVLGKGDVKLECKSCKHWIDEIHKTKMLQNGKWIKTFPEAKMAGFHLNALYSPLGWLSWTDIVEEYLLALKMNDPIKMKRVYNVYFAKTWKEQITGISWEKLFDERREKYKIGTVPKGGLVLIASVDVQKQYFACEIVAFGEEMESWSVDYRVIDGLTSDSRTWEKLDDFLKTKYQHELGAMMSINLTVIDSGDQSQTVYAWVAKRSKEMRVYAVKGVASTPVFVSNPVDANLRDGKRIIQSRALKLYKVGTNVAKTEFYGKLALKEDANGKKPYGLCHFPEYDEEYFKMLASETLTETKKGKFEYKKIRERNEALDCRIYAMAGAYIHRLDKFSSEKWEKIRQSLTVNDNQEEPNNEVSMLVEKYGLDPKKMYTDRTIGKVLTGLRKMQMLESGEYQRLKEKCKNSQN